MKTTSEQSDTAFSQPLIAKAQQTITSLPPILIAIAAISLFLTVTVGGALFFFPEVIQPRWVWPLKPYNTRFLGAIYLTASVGFTSLLASRGGGLVRLIVPMFFVFTTDALMVSCLQLQQFEVKRRITDIWFWLYLVDCVGATYYLGYFRHSFSGLRRPPRVWSGILGMQAGILGAYGLSLLFFPAMTGRGWLWPLDVFHSQLYSAIFLAGAVGAAVLSRRATASDLRALGVIQAVFSSLVLIGVWIVDREVQGIDWRMVVSWAWVGAIALLGITGLGLIQQSQKLKNSSWT